MLHHKVSCGGQVRATGRRFYRLWFFVPIFVVGHRRDLRIVIDTPVRRALLVVGGSGHELQEAVLLRDLEAEPEVPALSKTLVQRYRLVAQRNSVFDMCALLFVVFLRFRAMSIYSA